MNSIQRLVEAIQNSRECTEITPYEHDFLNDIKYKKILTEKQDSFLNRIRNKTWLTGFDFKGGQFEDIDTYEALALAKKQTFDAKAAVELLITVVQKNYDARKLSL